MKRKSIKSMIALVLATTMIVGSTGEIGAAEMPQAEQTQEATGISAAAAAKSPTLTLNKSKVDSLSSNEDENWYKFSVTTAGYFQVKMGCDDATDTSKLNHGWNVRVYKSDDLINSIDGADQITDREWISYCHAYAPGTTFYVKVDINDSYHPPIQGAKYDIKVSFTADSKWETERNDSNTTADKINVNTTYKGQLYWNGDEDWYKFTVTKPGYMRLCMGLDSKLADRDNISQGWRVTIYDSSFNFLRSYESITTNVVEPILAFGKGTYYVKVGMQNSGFPANGVVYNMKISSTSSTLWEQDSNGESTKANTLTLNKTYKGTTYYNTDQDWFKIKVPATGVVKITLGKDSSTNIENLSNGWNLNVYNADTTKNLVAINGIKSSYSTTLTLKKGTYYILVSENSYFAPVDCTYKLKTQYAKTPGKTSITKTAVTKTSAKVTWKKVSGATGYYVYRATSKKGKYSKVATIKKGSTVSYTNKKLKSKKNYYYKIMAYTTSNKITAKGSCSAVKAVKTK